MRQPDDGEDSDHRSRDSEVARRLERADEPPACSQALQQPAREPAGLTFPTEGSTVNVFKFRPKGAVDKCCKPGCEADATHHVQTRMLGRNVGDGTMCTEHFNEFSAEMRKLGIDPIDDRCSDSAKGGER